MLPEVLAEEEGAARTCGELRERVRRGEAPLTPGQVGSGALFSGTEPFKLASGFGIATFPASSYDNLWKIWGGFLMRPSNFDQRVSDGRSPPRVRVE